MLNYLGWSAVVIGLVLLGADAIILYRLNQQPASTIEGFVLRPVNPPPAAPKNGERI